MGKKSKNVSKQNKPKKEKDPNIAAVERILATCPRRVEGAPLLQCRHMSEDNTVDIEMQKRAIKDLQGRFITMDKSNESTVAESRIFRLTDWSWKPEFKGMPGLLLSTATDYILMYRCNEGLQKLLKHIICFYMALVEIELSGIKDEPNKGRNS